MRSIREENSLQTEWAKKWRKNGARSAAFYVPETWTLRKYEASRLETFEIWTWRYMQNISWKDHKNNEYALDVRPGKREKEAFKNLLKSNKSDVLGNYWREIVL